MVTKTTPRKPARARKPHTPPHDDAAKLPPVNRRRKNRPDVRSPRAAKIERAGSNGCMHLGLDVDGRCLYCGLTEGQRNEG